MALKWPSEFFTIVFISLLTGSTAGAEPSALQLKVTGEVKPIPGWQDENSTPLESVSFSFSNITASTESNIDIDSQSIGVKLVNALSYPAEVQILRPQSCAIGPTSVSNEHVAFLSNGAPLFAENKFSIANADPVSIALRFSSAGGYGTASGAVSCTSEGALTYGY